MAETFIEAYQRASDGSLPLGGLIDSAARLAAAGQVRQARQLYSAWIASNPSHPQLFVAHFNCSALATQESDSDAALDSLKQSIVLNPDFIPAYINLGSLFERSGNSETALDLWRTAASRPIGVTGQNVSYVTTALKQIARVCSDRQMNEDAEAAIRQCLEINPGQRDLVEQYIALRLAQCKWPVIAPLEFISRKQLIYGIHPLSMAVYTDDPLFQLACAARYVKETSGDVKPGDFDRRNSPINLSNRRMRVGYVSSDLRDHAIGNLIVEVFELHDRRKVEVFAYYCGPASSSALTARIRAAAEHWIDIRGLSDDEAAQRIAEDGIDVLVDVNGHTRDSRTNVFARRPAPIQVNWLGFPGSMGSPFHHYIVADDWIIPHDAEHYYSEKVVRLPCYQPNDRKRDVAEKCPERTEVGLPENGFVYCCFNGTHKINRSTFDRWMTVLKHVPGSVLWLLDAESETKARLGEIAERAGVSRERLIYAPKLQHAHHLARYQLADLFLDTLPYNAHTTASDALFMGVPVLTLSGRGFAARVGGSLVRAAGLPEFVCTRAEDYVERAIALGNGSLAIGPFKQRLKTVRAESTLFNQELLVSRLEVLYRDMIGDHQNGRLPEPELTNLEAYFEAGASHDHEANEIFAIGEYENFYKQQLSRLHCSRPLPADGRLWTARDIDAAQADRLGHGYVTDDIVEPGQKRRAGGSR